MDPVTVHAHISASREELFDFVSDLAARPSYTDGFLDDYRLAYPKSQGVGAAARYLVRAPLNRHYVETAIVEAERPFRIVERTHGGRGGRSRGENVFEFVRQGRTVTRVELTISLERGTLRERVMERFGTRRWVRRQAAKALERLRVIFEEPRRAQIRRATVAGFEPFKAPRFGMSTPVVRR